MIQIFRTNYKIEPKFWGVHLLWVGYSQEDSAIAHCNSAEEMTGDTLVEIVGRSPKVFMCADTELGVTGSTMWRIEFEAKIKDRIEKNPDDPYKNEVFAAIVKAMALAKTESEQIIANN